MNKSIYIAVLIICCYACKKEKQVEVEVKPDALTSFVNTFIGTDGPGNTYPGATVPFGMVQLSPDHGIPGWDRISGYFYPDSIISGFSHTHLSGTGAGDMYDILVMPTNSRSSKKIKENNFKPFSRFSHDNETASPGYYSVMLSDFGIHAEVTATRRTGIHQYTFPKDSLSQIHIDLGYSLNWDKPTETHFNIVDDTTIEGYRLSKGWARDQRLYFVIKLSKPFKSYTLLSEGERVESPITGVNTQLILDYSTAEQEKIVLKTGLSTASIDGAYKSIQSETPGFNFEDIKAEADDVWNKQLQKIKIETDDVEKKTIFYTMMYQSMLAPTLLSDLNGDYKGANDSIMSAQGYDRYDTFSLWDTYRAAHPLHTILHPERVSSMINSLLAHYNETGLLPVWSMQGNETNMMIGYHAVPVIVDAYFKGVKNFDAELAFEACKQSAMDDSRQIDDYMTYGYVPIDDDHENWSVSKTLEYAYDDWCIAQFAKDLGKEVDYKYFSARANNWKNIYDSKSTFMRPKYKDGKFIEHFIPKEYTPYFCESNAWQYVWSVPQDVEGLIDTIGRETAFETKLDSMFSYYPLANDKLPIFSTGMIGQYAHGNEPSHHVGYLYNYIGKPWKTQEKVREILETQYKNAPNGHCGNEDCGQMSSWYIFSSLGFYPVNPAQGVYSFGSPLFDKATLNLENGNTFTVLAENNSKANKYIQSITLNGTAIKQSYITHKTIMEGGELIFVMGDQPNKNDAFVMAPSSQVFN
ncbi:GH92 family glycosyl hydrolase [Formosa algae]|uniref:Alpha-1,2-mannosidase n=1 Tax=Formosa algae TaxID=225843 RepID=A0A9X0YNB2_9FLAO|nr:GH92 family glycosyl hydrolase [Formosa algae]MBP1840053.1 putative alpha-1,2-mannosidase [Formosa algae]MDQ0335653.1 putative alpha-1,2-mannosidase [Formosa algae]OEI78711.1 alpha-mannosidase [Formosa algae]